MYFLETLGRIRLTDASGREVERLMQQPKRLALLAYLASPAPGTWHRRDVLLGLLWPELDATHARTALRNALHVLRQHMDGVIRTRGDDDVSLDPALFSTDSAEMERDAAAGRDAETFARYRGEYLRGLYIKEAESYERWLDDERRRLLAIAKRAGLAAADASERAGDAATAIALIERVAGLDPHDESVVRRLIALLDRIGDRARALATYERFRARLSEDLDAEASAETIVQIEAIRSRRVPRVDPRPDEVQPVPLGAPLAAHDAQPTAKSSSSRRSFGRVVAGVGVVIAAVIASVAFRGHSAKRVQQLIILPTENLAAESLAYVGPGIADEVARRLRGMGGLQTRSAAFGRWPDSIRTDLPRIARDFGATVALRTALSDTGDSLVLSAELIDIATRNTQPAGRYVFSAGDMLDVSSRLSAVVAGRLFRALIPQAPHAVPSGMPNSESFRLAMSGWYYQLNAKGQQPESLFLAAIRRDPTNARAWAGLSSVYTVRVIVGAEEWSSAVPRAEDAGRRAMALDSLEGTPLGNMAITLALRTHRLAAPESLLARAIALDPGNAELYVIKAAIYRHAWQFDKARDAFRIARQLDPLAPGILDREAALELCAGKNQEALALARAAAIAYPTDPSKHQPIARTLARMGQWNDALAELRLADTAHSSTVDSIASSGITAEAAYWEIAERPWRVQLANSERAAARGEWVNPYNLAVQHVAAGDLDVGLSLLEKVAPSGDPQLYKLPCLVQVDRIRGTRRYNAIVASLPKWEQ